MKPALEELANINPEVRPFYMAALYGCPDFIIEGERVRLVHPNLKDDSSEPQIKEAMRAAFSVPLPHPTGKRFNRFAAAVAAEFFSLVPGLHPEYVRLLTIEARAFREKYGHE